MKQTPFALAAQCAALCAAMLAAPVAAESWLQPSGSSTYVPVGVAPAPEPAPVARDGRTVIVTNGPVIIVPGQPAPLEPAAQTHRDRYLPLRCLETYEASSGELRLFEAGCLADNDVNVRDLPSRCAVSIRTTRDLLRGYDPSCLRDVGYRMAGD